MSLKDRDRKVNWHPFSPLHDEKIIPLVKAEGSYLFAENGSRFIDLVSSWWVNLHGHRHPHLMNALKKQADELDHIIFAGFTHPRAVELSERLLEFVPGNFSRVFYSDDGSTANEVALKMALQYFILKGKKRKKIIAFENAYHGDTFGAMSMAGRTLFNAKFEDWLFSEVVHIPVPVEPYSDEEWKAVKAVFDEDTAAFIFEPVLQGAAGMIVYDSHSLDALLKLADEKGIITIADEVLTGFGRTGEWFACNYLQHTPDMMCLSKGITGGVLPLGVTMINKKVEEAFRGNDKNALFYHGHSYTANALSCAVACANLELLDDSCMEKIKTISGYHRQFMKNFKHPEIHSLRSIGVILAMNYGSDSSYTAGIRDTIYDYFIKKGLLMRPLGNVIYCIPPYCINKEDLEEFYSAVTGF